MIEDILIMNGAVRITVIVLHGCTTVDHILRVYKIRFFLQVKHYKILKSKYLH